MGKRAVFKKNKLELLVRKVAVIFILLLSFVLLAGNTLSYAATHVSMIGISKSIEYQNPPDIYNIDVSLQGDSTMSGVKVTIPDGRNITLVKGSDNKFRTEIIFASEAALCAFPGGNYVFTINYLDGTSEATTVVYQEPGGENIPCITQQPLLINPSSGAGNVSTRVLLKWQPVADPNILSIDLELKPSVDISLPPTAIEYGPINLSRYTDYEVMIAFNRAYGNTNTDGIPYVIDADAEQKFNFWTGAYDADNDGIPDYEWNYTCTGGETTFCDDNCMTIPNSDQADIDEDGIGNACDNCTDMDNDGYASEGGVCSGVDCNDNDSTIYPGAPEKCDGKVNDCNNPAASDGSGEPWYGSLTTCGTGACSSTGQFICSEAVKTDTCTPVAGAEICDGIDNNCNGLIDEDSASAIAGGKSHTIALMYNGPVMAWGYNGYGQVGDGTTTDRNTPIKVSGITSVKSIAGRSDHSLALKNDGTVWAWGRNYWGQLGDGTTNNRYSPVKVNGLAGVNAIAGGGAHSIALKNDGTVWAWGNNDFGQLGDGTRYLHFTPVNVNYLTGVKAIAGGEYHSIALKNDGTVWAWGMNNGGQLGDGTINDRYTPVKVNDLTRIIAIAIGSNHSLALKDDGTVWAWGSNGRVGALGDGTINGISYTPVKVSGLTDVKAIAGGFSYYSLALKDDGTVWAWGNNDSGQLGDGTVYSRYTPVKVKGLTGIIAIAGGGSHSIALKNDGTVWAWGNNGFGQLGDGTTGSKNTPIQVSVTAHTDVDSDGYVIEDVACGADCNDMDPLINPGAADVCDGMDNNCNGNIDEGVTYYRDADGDSYGNPSLSTQACSQPIGYVANNIDCNDYDAIVKPGASDICDGKDNDCNASTSDGSGESWYSPEGPKGNATCSDGLDNDCEGATDRVDTDCRWPGEGNIDLPQTGQTKCYNSAGAEIACTGTGQDGEIRAGAAWPDPRFTVGTGAEADCVIDNLTGLMWPKNGKLAGISKNWNDAIDFANNLTFCGHDDWHLPNVSELESLANADVSNTATWLISNGFTNVRSDYFWSSTSDAYNPTYYAWVVGMLNGYVSYVSSVNKDSNSYYVWPVRSGQGGSFGYSKIWKTGQTVSYRAGDDGDLKMGVAWPNPRFTVGTSAEADCVTDNLTGLMWSKDANLAGSVYWNAALIFTNNSTLCGYSDWHLPNRKEQRSIIDYSRYTPALPAGNPFTNVQSYNYWSSTSSAGYTNYALIVNMWNGLVGYGYKGNGSYYVWPVRSGQVAGSFDYYCDSDNDGHKSSAISGSCTGNGCVPAGCQITPGDDCNDGDASIYPGAPEICDNGVDDDCDGKIDTDDPDCAVQCVPTTEICDGLDNDCDGQVDDGVKNTYYRDIDGDSYGNSSNSIQACAQPAGYVSNNKDCDDSNANINPSATEICDGTDNDCNAATADGSSEPWLNTTCDGNDSDLCNEGTFQCTSGAKTCSDTTGDNIEICGNTTDDDCDGIADIAENDCINPPTTPGQNVKVTPVDQTTGKTPVDITFDTVTVSGTTSVTTSNTGQSLPNGYMLGEPPVYYEIMTTALYSGNIQVCINYIGATYFNEDALKLYHYEKGEWKDVTLSLDTVNDKICGNVLSLSPFVILEPLCTDADKDGYAVEGGVCGQVDCDDTNVNINPGRPDANCNGVDENCSGIADDGYVSVPTTCGIGACTAAGQLICRNGQLNDNCTPGEPTTESTSVTGTCSDKKDNDCNGFTDLQDTNCPATTLNVKISGKGGVTSNPSGISCKGICSSSYARNTNVSITAKPAKGYKFKKWTSVCSKINKTKCTIKLSRNQTVTAVFKKRR